MVCCNSIHTDIVWAQINKKEPVTTTIDIPLSGPANKERKPVKKDLVAAWMYLILVLVFVPTTAVVVGFYCSIVYKAFQIGWNVIT